MFTRGILAAMIVAGVWILLHVLIMQIRPARRRIRAMLTGYLCSLPFVYVAYRWLPLPVDAPTTGDAYVGLGLFHAYLSHLLLFFPYMQLFSHVERSVTGRLLVMVMQAPGHTANLGDIQRAYSTGDMVEQRLALLEQNRFIVQREGRWHNRAKGRALAVAMACSCRLFRSKAQSERL
ncbi:MAG: hypothetical protein K8T26_05855 [Lentisphaerae bacterium]|nr:hypothetical protein [Lentisphaerota bacterium]